MFKKITSLFSSQSWLPDSSYWIYVRCNRCSEKIQGRVDLRNDLTPDYDAEGGAQRYFCRKVLIGSGYCFQQIELKLTFDLNRKLVDKEVRGGEFINKDEFEAG